MSYQIMSCRRLTGDDLQMSYKTMSCRSLVGDDVQIDVLSKDVLQMS